MLLHPPQPSSSSAIAHYNLLPAPRPAPLPPRATPRSLAAVDRLPLQPPNPTLRADVHRLPDSPLAHPHNYHYVPRPLPVHSSDSPDAMYHQPHHVQPHLYDQHPHSTHPNPTAPPPNPEPDFDPPRQQPPSIHTDNLLYPTESGDYSPSPLSSPSDNQVPSQSSGSRPFSFPQPMSAPHSQNAFPPRYTNEQEPPRFPFPTQTLDRRMSEPVLGAGRQAYAQLPPPAPHDTFAYSAASSTTVIQPSPVSPRPSSSYSYGSYPGHERDNSGASIGSGGAPDAYPSSAWGAGIKHADLDQETALASSPLSPLYAASAASGSDASATGLPSPPIQSRPSPSRQMAQLSGRTMPAPPTSSNTPRVAGNSKTYSFVSLPGNAVKKRPRRRYDEIERLYQCSWPGCTKAYGTLNHLNAHVTMQRHGSKRSPNEFKELRKQWRQQKKEAEEQEREREREAAQMQAMTMRDMHYAAHQAQMEYDHHRHLRRRLSMVDPYPDPHSHPHSLPNHSYMHAGMQSPGAGAFGGPPQGVPPYGSLQGPAMGLESRYGLQSPADDMSLRYHQPSQPQVGHGLPSISLAHHGGSGPEDDMYFRGPPGAGQQLPNTPHGEPVGPGWATPHPPHQQAHHAHGMRPPQPFYTSSGASSSITLPPPHTLGSLSSSAPNPSPLSGSTFPSLGPSTGPPSELSMGLHPPVPDGGASSDPELVAHVSLGSNRLPPDSTLLTPLPGYEPDAEQGGEPEFARGEHERERAWDRGRERDRYYAGAAQGGGGRDLQYE